ncbi:divalent-cation tolerance protein CutA [Ehrlichia ruminantium]|uniref:Divalent-cation tolerance protein CutA n=1 Tax=Ehrlichia ruminantium TaxID=779 RepID=A0AAE6Q8U0_EHRRU|nr:divalent-cation tolerance protein CutA [Ehrlichia ruminantium]QGR02406.1 divalent-cation tolerance protein CutA [Ehrlichia ruminantium]QGR03324.1 divalent-cation tolerance protein CutA [Ehrlichia ruminantium]QGR04251.1 divalent-cation tolerance protein CutA [Ehrlichia ruminantium]
MDNISLIYTTTSNYEDAYNISKTLLEHKLIACANIFNNVTSIYSWENEVHNTAEYVIILKTTKNLVQETTDKIHEIHPYDTPAIITIDPTNTNDKFLHWVNDYIKS